MGPSKSNIYMGGEITGKKQVGKLLYKNKRSRKAEDVCV